MAFQSMNLPYESGALEPYISAKTMSFHHDKHYKKYVATLNELTAKSSIAVGNLEETMLRSHNVDNAVFQNAAQVWNHEFFWKCLSPAKKEPSKQMLDFLEANFGSAQGFKENFERAAQTLFGSGWVWVVANNNGSFEIQALEKAENPMTSGQIPLFVCDVWEHAYYLDYQNDRGKYINQIWAIINWKYFEKNVSAIASPAMHTPPRGKNESHLSL